MTYEISLAHSFHHSLSLIHHTHSLSFIHSNLQKLDWLWFRLGRVFPPRSCKVMMLIRTKNLFQLVTVLATIGHSWLIQFDKKATNCLEEQNAIMTRTSSERHSLCDKDSKCENILDIDNAYGIQMSSVQRQLVMHQIHIETILISHQIRIITGLNSINSYTKII